MSLKYLLVPKDKEIFKDYQGRVKGLQKAVFATTRLTRCGMLSLDNSNGSCNPVDTFKEILIKLPTIIAISRRRKTRKGGSR